MICCGKALGSSGCMLIRRACVSWFWGRGSSYGCCSGCFGKSSLPVYEWVSGLGGEEVMFFICCKYGV